MASAHARAGRQLSVRGRRRSSQRAPADHPDQDSARGVRTLPIRTGHSKTPKATVNRMKRRATSAKVAGSTAPP